MTRRIVLFFIATVLLAGCIGGKNEAKDGNEPKVVSYRLTSATGQICEFADSPGPPEQVVLCSHSKGVVVGVRFQKCGNAELGQDAITLYQERLWVKLPAVGSGCAGVQATNYLRVSVPHKQKIAGAQLITWESPPPLQKSS